MIKGNVKKNGYLYIHYYDVEAISLIAAFNARRLANKKRPYAVLVKSEVEKRALEDSKTRFFSGVKRHTPGPGRRMTSKIQYHPIGIENPEIREALKQTTILSGRFSTLGPADKLYILGHGANGKHIVIGGSQGKGFIEIRELVWNLKEAKLSKEIRDIRLDICESADHVKLTAFSELTSYKYYFKSFFDGRTSAAQALSEQLYYAGYPDIIVSGYHGIGLINYRTGPDAHRETAIDSDYLTDETTARASTVRQAFRNGWPVADACLETNSRNQCSLQ